MADELGYKLVRWAGMLVPVRVDHDWLFLDSAGYWETTADDPSLGSTGSWDADSSVFVFGGTSVDRAIPPPMPGSSEDQCYWIGD